MIWALYVKKPKELHLLNGFSIARGCQIALEWISHHWKLISANKNYPQVMTNIAIENGPVEIVSFPINSMVDLSIVFCMFTRGYGTWSPCPMSAPDVLLLQLGVVPIQPKTCLLKKWGFEPVWSLWSSPVRTVCEVENHHFWWANHHP